MKESYLKSRVIKYLKSCPDIWFAKLDDRTHSAYPDIIGLVWREQFGIFFAIELKVGNNKPTPLQEFTLKKIREIGGIAFWSNSFVDVKNKVEFLRIKKSK